MRLHPLFAAVSSLAILAGAAQAQSATSHQPKAAAPAAAMPAPGGPGSAVAPPAAPSAAETSAPSAVPTAPAAQVVASGDLIETAKASGQFTIFLKALDATNLTGVLKNNKGLTIFAPTDAAFAAVPQAELAKLMTPANSATLQKVLAYHVVNTTVDSARVKGTKGPIKSVEGSELLVDDSGEHFMVDGATVVQADIKATNGTLHVIDKVLMPADLPAVTAALSVERASADCQTSPSDPMTSSGPAGAPAPAAPMGDMSAPATDPASAAPPASVSDPAAAPPAAAPPSAADPAAAPMPAPGMPADSPAVAPAAAVPTVVATMQPVPDTAENRAKYGKPDSHAGKRSPPKGN